MTFKKYYIHYTCFTRACIIIRFPFLALAKTLSFRRFVSNKKELNEFKSLLVVKSR